MQTLSENDIDQLCEQYEDDWRPATAGVDGISAFMSRCGVPQPTDTILASTLAQVDIERSWMAWARKIDSADPRETIYPVVGQTETGCLIGDLVASLKSLPSFKDYHPLFACPGAFQSVQTALARCECCCREQWGDALGAVYYKQSYGIHIENSADFTPRSVGVEIDGHRGKTVPTFQLRGCNRFGRRRSFDTADFLCEELLDGNRIVIAGFREAEISRQRFTLQILSASKVAIRNQCPINPLRVMGQQELTYQQQVLLAYPFSIRLPGRTLRFF